MSEKIVQLNKEVIKGQLKEKNFFRLDRPAKDRHIIITGRAPITGHLCRR